MLFSPPPPAPPLHEPTPRLAIYYKRLLVKNVTSINNKKLTIVPFLQKRKINICKPQIENMTHAHIHKVKKVPMKSKHRQIKGDKMVTDSIIIGASNAKVIAVNQSMLLSFEIAMMKIGATLFTTDFIVFFHCCYCCCCCCWRRHWSVWKCWGFFKKSFKCY